MVRVIFDTNIHDRLAKDQTTCEAIARLHARVFVKVIVTRTIAEELHESPFHGIPDFFPVEVVGNTVAIAGIMRAGDSLGSGHVYFEHLGKSIKANDAFIADAASRHADGLVSWDDRLRRRSGSIGILASPTDYDEFLTRLDALLAEPGSEI